MLRWDGDKMLNKKEPVFAIRLRSFGYYSTLGGGSFCRDIKHALLFFDEREAYEMLRRVEAQSEVSLDLEDVSV